MPIRRRPLVFGLLAVFPALASAQDAKLVNCRTLEAAGNFVGPDEVIVDDMVCQKAKPGAGTAAKQQAQKPIAGAVVSETPAESVVDAAKAAERRVAIRREQDAGRNAAGMPSAASATPDTSNAVPAEGGPEVSVSAPKIAEPSAASTATAPEPAPVASSPAAQPAAQSDLSLPERPAQAFAPPAPAAKPEIVAPAETAPGSPPSPENAAAVGESPTPAAASEASPTKREPQLPAPTEIAVSSAPASAPPTAAAVAEPVAASPAPAPAEPAPADPPRPAGSSGFYDANAPKVAANAGLQSNTGFASAAQVNAGLTPGASSIPAATQPAAPEVPAAAPESEAQPATVAAARIDFDADRDRSVKLGDFVKPREAETEQTNEHRTSVDPSDADGFQDRQRPECTKNVTLAGLSGETLVLGVPAWAAKWIEKNEKRTPQICFSETPMKGARNYLIVFSTPAGQTSKNLADAAVNAKGGNAGVGTFTTLYGSTWHYSFDRNVGTTILTQDDADEPHGTPGQVLYATAYTEEGVPVAQRWPGQLKKEIKPSEKNPKKLKGETEALEHVSSDLLGQMVDDIEKL
jgi:hypothetical protein